MKRLFMSACVVAALLAVPAYAMLTVGAKAPDFKARASIGGKQFDFSLADAQAEGRNYLDAKRFAEAALAWAEYESAQ